ncbi:MAG: hypothetical protein LBV75_04285 [Paludibacter sp.]|jgi:hypothetical protein|nr:hypothetical protein [Paludibacter sp.]
MKSNIFLIIAFIVLPVTLTAQNNICKLTKSNYSELQTVTPEQVRCIAQNSDKDISIFFGYAAWCSDALLQQAIDFAAQQNADLYILLIDKEDDIRMIETSTKTLDKATNVLIISDSLYTNKLKTKKTPKFRFIAVYGKKYKEKYANFLTEITTPQFENVVGLSKYIVLNNNGETIFVSSNKDTEANDALEKAAGAIEKNRKESKESKVKS